MLRRSALALLVLGLACGKGGGGSSPAATNNVAPSLSPLVCKPGCAARPADGAAALKGGNYDGALDAYRCADTPEAAFGAGVATLVTAIEGPSAKSVLADFGEQPIAASAVVGQSGWLSRFASRWKGSGSIARTDPAGAELDRATFELGRERRSGGSFASVRLLGPASLARVSLSLSLGSGPPPSAGERFPIGCGGSGRSASLSYSTPTLSCYATAPDCTNGTSGGAVVVTKAAAAAGESAEYTLEDVAVSCSTGSGGSSTSRLKGTLSAVLAPEKVDLAGLPALLTGDATLKVPPGVTVEKVLASASGLAGSFEMASCYFNAAGTGAGDGEVFELPAELLGGTTAVPVSRGDAKVLAGLASLSAAAIVLVEAYRLPIELRGLLCSKSAGIPCLSDEETVSRVNAGVQALADKQKIEIARRLVSSALTSFSESVDGLGPNSLFVKDATTQSSIERIKGIVDKLLASLSSGRTALPYVSPELAVDLKALFDSPPDPAAISVDPLSYDPVAKRVENVDAFWEQAFPASTTDWLRSNDKKYTFDNGKGLVLESMSYRFEGYFPISE